MKLKFMKKKRPEEWASIEDHEIDEILDEIDGLPETLSSLRDHLNEFSTAVNILKKNKKPDLVRNVHNRARHLSEVFENLAKRFEIVSKESTNLEEMDNHIRENLFTIEIVTFKGDRAHPVIEKGKVLVLGGRKYPALWKLYDFPTNNIRFLAAGNKVVCSLTKAPPTFLVEGYKGRALRREEVLKAGRVLSNDPVELILNKDFSIYSFLTGERSETAFFILRFKIAPFR